MAGDACTSGYKNVGVGGWSFTKSNFRISSIAIGWEAGIYGGGYRNVAIGDMAGRTFGSAVECIAIVGMHLILGVVQE